MDESVSESEFIKEADDDNIEPEAYRTCSGPAAPNMYSGAEPSKGRRRRIPGDVGSSELVVQEFVGQLREFRELQRELAPWTDKFRAAHGRKPRYEDVQATGR